MHATIGAVSGCVPTLPLAYSRKFKGVFNTIGYNYSIDIKDKSIEDIESQLLLMINEKYSELLLKVNLAQEFTKTKTNNYIDSISKIICKLK